MKKGTIFAVVLSVLVILALMGLGVYLMIDLQTSGTDTAISQGAEGSGSADGNDASMNDAPGNGSPKNNSPGNGSPESVSRADNFPPDADSSDADRSDSDRESSDASSDGSAPSMDEQTAAAHRAAQAANAPLPEHHLIFVGDSRTVGMGEAEGKLGDTCTYIGEVGEGYYWFSDSGLPRMENAIAQYPDSPVILNLGVNDPDQIDRYLELYATFADRYPTTSFYFMSVNPVTEDSVHINNEEIAAFNTQLKAAFPEQYLDSYTYLHIQEFTSPDGVHYSKDTYRMIHDFAVNQVGK